MQYVAPHIPFMDGFLGYNQIKMMQEDMEKITFVTSWRTLLQGYAIWVKECRGHLLKGHGDSISLHDAQRDRSIRG